MSFRVNFRDRMRVVWHILKNTVQLFINHDTFTQGAALSYFTIFSIAPMLLLVISLAGIILGPEAVTGHLKQQLQGLLGADTSDQIQTLVQEAYNPGKNWIATTVSIVLLLFGAIGMFDQLRKALNTIWDIKPSAKKPFIRFLLNRLFSFAMIAVLAFLLLISLVLHATLQAFEGYLETILPHISVLLINGLDLILSFLLTSLLFAFLYKYMSDARLRIRQVWRGALFTTFLFIIGKYLIGLYISKTQLGVTYGAAGSVVIILAWVFYSSQIVFFGAEFTRALAVEKGEALAGAKEKSSKETGVEGKKVKEKKNRPPLR